MEVREKVETERIQSQGQYATESGAGSAKHDEPEAARNKPFLYSPAQRLRGWFGLTTGNEQANW